VKLAMQALQLQSFDVPVTTGDSLYG